jgi:hypothetical protein
VAAFLYTVTPLSYLILSYSSYPTLFALFLTMLTFTLILFMEDRLERPWILALFVALLTLSLLAYPVVAVFNVLVVVTYGSWRWWQATSRAAKRRAVWLPMGTALAAVIAFLAYYVQYVGVVLRSVHTLTTQTAEARGYVTGGLPGVPRHIVATIVNNIRVGNLLILLAIAAAGMIVLRRQSLDADDRRTWRFLLVWVLILPVFTLVDAYIDMILKQLFYTMIPLALFGGIAIVWLWRRGRVGQVMAVLCCLAITGQAWWLWVQRLTYGGHSGPT